MPAPVIRIRAIEASPSAGEPGIRDNGPMSEPQPLATGQAGTMGRPDRLVQVAIDAAGPGGARAYTCHVPQRLDDLQASEAVVVGFGSRQVLGVILGDADE